LPRLAVVMKDTVLLLAMNGLIWGLIIALIALGLSVIFGLLDIINIAHGDFFMVGTVLAWFSLAVTGNFWIGFIVAPIIGFILGAIIQRLVTIDRGDLRPFPHPSGNRADNLRGDAAAHIGADPGNRAAVRSRI
jgi:hypothetical protein